MNGIIRIVVSIYLMIISFFIINLIAGPGGLFKYNMLDSYKTSISENIGDLERINKSLQIESDSLMHDSNEIKIKARELGWIDYNEGIIVVKGFSQSQSGYSMGKLLSREQLPVQNGTVFRLIAVMVGLLFYIATGFLGKNRTNTI